MGKMMDGEWTTQWYGHQASGEFIREDTVFRERLTREGLHRPGRGRYHLYVSYACPWASRVLMARAMYGLEDVLEVSAVHPFMGDDGWTFETDSDGATGDRVKGARFLREVYKRADDHYTGRVTVPVLWDRELGTIVNNESRDLLEMFDEVLAPALGNELTLYPERLIPEINLMIDANYHPINNGVYRCGFASSQRAYDRAVTELFARLEQLDALLATQRYLCGDVFTAADVCLFPTLVRFDSVYATHFKCDIKQLREFEHLWAYTREIYQMPGISETVNMTHIRDHYFTSHETINPKRIVSAGPRLDFQAEHGRERLPGRFARRG